MLLACLHVRTDCILVLSLREAWLDPLVMSLRVVARIY
jgi:hypothetical protein